MWWPSVYLSCAILLLSWDIRSSHALCDEPGFNSLSVPSHFDGSRYQVDNGKLKIRCASGKIFVGTNVEDHHLAINCVNDTWEEPSPWPPTEECDDGAPCTAPDDLPNYLELSNQGQNYSSGSFLTFNCNDSFYGADYNLKGQMTPFSRECFNGVVLPNAEHDLAYPPSLDCVPNVACNLAIGIFIMEVPDHITTNEYYYGTVNHGSRVDFFCRENRKMDAKYDPDGDNKISVLCEGGKFERPLAWPLKENCKGVCSIIPEIGTASSFQTVTYPMEVLEGDALTLVCKEPNHFLDTDWVSTSYDLICNSNRFFNLPSVWPSCRERPTCQTPPDAPTWTGLEPVDPTATPQVTMYASYQCKNDSLVTDSGAIINLMCEADTAFVSGSKYKLPSLWGTEAMTCREKQRCNTPPTPPTWTGLKMPAAPADGYFEFDKVNYTCKDSSHILYEKSRALDKDMFQAQCAAPGKFQQIPEDDWPYCDVENPTPCSDFLQVPSKTPQLPITRKTTQPVKPFDYAEYECNDPSLVTTLGRTAKVMCTKDFASNTVAFEEPSGWKSLACKPAHYPSLKEPYCFCLGDPLISVKQSKEILDKVCRSDKINADINNMYIPYKKRCGVKDLGDISQDNICYCTEKSNNSASFAVWATGVLKTHKWDSNYTAPFSLPSLRLQKEVQIEIDRMFLNYEPIRHIWWYVRSYVITFVPGEPLQCSKHVIPEPPENTGLVVKEVKTVRFGEYIQFKCKKNGFVTNDGLTYDLKCLENGKFQERLWLECRERVTCIKAPPRPSAESKLARSESSYINEFDHAVYRCQNEDEVVPDTEDGQFRAVCKRTGDFDQSVRIDWPTCIPRPAEYCTSPPDPPAGYVLKSKKLQFILAGEKITYACSNPDNFIGSAPEVSYTCEVSNRTARYRGLDSGLPACRSPSICPWYVLPDSSSSPSFVASGLTKPILSQNLKETQFVEYTCQEGRGNGWSLFGKYRHPFQQFQANGAEIVGGKLRLYCQSNGLFGSVTEWPQCRDESIVQCDDTSSNLQLNSYQLRREPSGPISVTGTATVSCITPGYVTENFGSTELKCNYDGTFLLSETFTACRPAETCPAAPEPASEYHLVKGPPATNEYDDQIYNCDTGYTLNGVVHDLVDNGQVRVPCKIVNGEFVMTSQLPTCLPATDKCLTVPTYEGFVPSMTGPVNVGTTVTYSCATPGHVTDIGPDFTVTCTDSGLFIEPEQLYHCRAAILCQSPPVPDFNTSRLMPSTSVGVTEFGIATYRCQEGSALPDGLADANGYFPLQCSVGGMFPQPNWPTCVITHCLEIEDKSGFSRLGPNIDKTPVGSFVNYTCANPGWIVEDSLEPIYVECLSSGVLNYPDPMPTCRSRTPCSHTLPDPLSPSNLVKPTTGISLLKEFDHAYYTCPPGADLDGVVNENIEGGAFKVRCGLNGGWPDAAAVSWVSCTFRQCFTIPEVANFRLDTPPPIDVGSFASYSCGQVNSVIPTGATWDVECGANGVVNSANPPTCVERLECGTPPVPTPGTFLSTTMTSVKEFDFAVYTCKEGSTLSGSPEAEVSGEEFRVECTDVGGRTPGYSTPSAWSQCTVLTCPRFITIPSMVPVDTSPVPKGASASYKCSDNTKVVVQNLQRSNALDVVCGNDGEFEAPSPDAACEAMNQCGSYPVPGPDASTGLLNSETPLPVNEFDYITYTCMDGRGLSHIMATNPDVIDAKTFRARCVDSSFPSISFPTCQFEECVSPPTLPGMTTDDSLPAPIGGKLTYRCQNTDFVSDQGSSFEVTCNSAGQFDLPPGDLTCRSPATCSGPAPIPTAGANHNLQESTDTDVPEFGRAEYACNPGTFLVESQDPGKIINGKFTVECGVGGSYPSSISYPECKHYKCETSDPSLSSNGFVSETTGPIYVGGKALVKCGTSGQVTDIGEMFEVQCNSDGTFMEPSGGWPTCRARGAAACPQPPSPDAAKNFKPHDNSSDVLEFQDAVFECKNGYELAPGRTEFRLRCQLGASSYEAVDFPQCGVPTCTPDHNEIKLKAVPNPVPGLSTATFSCISTADVMDQGKMVESQCQADGTLSPLGSSLTCRLPSACTESPPTPGVGSFLKPSESVVTNEWDEAVYECMDGYSLVGSPDEANPMVDNMGKFRVPCQTGGTFSSGISWPTCLPCCTSYANEESPVPADMENVIATPNIALGGHAPLRCRDSGRIMDTNEEVALRQCADDGIGNLRFNNPPGGFPSCRKRAQCSFPPNAPSDSQWELVSPGPITEGDHATYQCSSGYQYVRGKDLPDGMHFDNNVYSYQLRCGSTGHIEIPDYWASSGWPKCTAVPSKRKKRATNDDILEDIDYSVRVIFEMQFMYNDTVAKDILDKYDVSWQDHENFTTHLVVATHEYLNDILGTDLEIKPTLALSKEFEPLCDQPTNADMTGQCHGKTHVKAICPGFITGAWIASLGYGYHQQDPEWTNASVVPYITPVGEEVSFYCLDSLKRPRRDDRDNDNSDGIISAYCTHSGKYSVSENPAEWDKCRRLCPISKPEPPNRPGAQLIQSDSDAKWERELWEGETISYHCKNASLVLFNKNDQRTVVYSCGENGEYDAPGPDNDKSWPMCDVKPIDPVIIDAVRILTGKFDRNVDYKNRLGKANTTGVDFLETTEGIITITAPIVGAIIFLVFLIMCCTRSNSPICKIFEPKS